MLSLVQLAAEPKLLKPEPYLSHFAESDWLAPSLLEMLEANASTFSGFLVLQT